MARTVDLIQLEIHDDVITVRDRLSFVESHRVLLVWPERGNGHILRRKLDLVLLQREIRRMSARMALVTSDPLVIQHARELNISTFPSIKASKRSRWKRGSSDVFVTRSDKPNADNDAVALRSSVKRVRRRPRQIVLSLRRLASVLFLIIATAAVTGLGYLLLPSATVTIVPSNAQLDVSVRVVADPLAQTIDLENHVIPATVLNVEIDASATVETTGAGQVDPIPAQGTIVFTNQTNETVTIPAGTTVATSVGVVVRFRTLEAVDIAGQQTAIAAVPIEAVPEFGGEIGNVPAYAIDHIDGPLADLLTAQNLEPTSGGVFPANRVVAPADHERLLATARQAIQQRALGDLTPRLGDGQIILPESIHIAEERPEWTVFSAEIGAEAATVSLNMRGVVLAIVIDERMVNQAAYAGLTQQIPSGQIVIPESIAFTRGQIETIDPSGWVAFPAHVSGTAISAVDASAAVRRITGMTSAQATNYLSENLELEPGTQPVIEIWPGIFDQLPLLSQRITIMVRETR